LAFSVRPSAKEKTKKTKNPFLPQTHTDDYRFD
jgi:hypothetical protein